MSRPASAAARAPSLSERHADLTERVIVEAAVALLERDPAGELTVRAAARAAGVSERTVFRYFASRDALLDAIAGEVRERLALPPAPKTLEELRAAPRALYTRFEEMRNLTIAALHTEIFPRMRDSTAKERWLAARRIVDALAPERPERERRIAAANVRYFLAASTWHYYRFQFRFSLEDTIACAETAIAQAIEGLRR